MSIVAYSNCSSLENINTFSGRTCKNYRLCTGRIESNSIALSDRVELDFACTGNPEVSRHFHPRSGNIILERQGFTVPGTSRRNPER